MSANLTDQDYELLSDYLDGVLTDDERLALEDRLASDVELRRELAYFRQTVALINQLPELRAPRDFTLDSKMIGPRVIPRLVVRRRINIGLLSAVAATFIVIIGAMVVLSLMSPTIGNVFSNVISGLQSGGSGGGAVPAANQVAQGPTPMPSITFQRGLTETNETQDDFAAASNANAPEPLTPSATLAPAGGLAADTAQEQSLEPGTPTPQPTEKVAADALPNESLAPSPSATPLFGYLADETTDGTDAAGQTEPAAEMQLYAESPSELDTSAATGRIETTIPPGTAGEGSPPMPAISLAPTGTSTETISTGAMAAAQPTVTSDEETENAQRDRRDSLDFVRIIVEGTVIVTVGVIIFVLQRQTP